MTGRVNTKPWWKERLLNKPIKTCSSAGHLTNRIDTKSWTFLKGGLDDFRDGFPVHFDDDDIFIKGVKGPTPPVTGGKEDGKTHKSSPLPVRPLTGYLSDQAVLSTRTPTMQKRADLVQRLEDGLIKHPMALFPHLEECMAPDLFEEVVEILDPEMKHAMDTDSEENIALFHQESGAVLAPQCDTNKGDEAEEPVSRDKMVNNPYLWRPPPDEMEKNDKRKSDQPKLSSKMQDEEILPITKEFCEWVANIGGDTNNLDEQTVLSLFASGYETKPALSVPIHIVELNDIPPELRPLATESSKQTNQPGSMPALTHKGTLVAAEPVRYRYGAWYLSPKTWQRLPANEPLKNPKDNANDDVSDIRKKSLQLDADLAPMHGTKLFMQFMDKKETRKPEFLVNVSKLQAQQLQEEQLKREAELLKQRKLLARQKMAH